MKSNLRFCASLVWETAFKNRSTSVPLAFLMKKLKSKVVTGMFELIDCANSEMNAVFCKGVLVVGADAGGSSVSCAGSRTLGCWCCCCFFTMVHFLVDDSDRTVMQPALKIARFCNFSPEIMFTWFRGIIAEARDENPVNEPLMTKVSKKSTQTGSDSSNSTHDLRNRSCL